MSSLAPLHSHTRGCLHGSLEAAAAADVLRDLPLTSEGLPRAEQERIPSSVLHSLRAPLSITSSALRAV